MKHVGEEALDTLEDLLIQIRCYQGLKEKKRGVFYWKSRAFLHFHEDQEGLFADLRSGEDWKRFSVTTEIEREVFLAQLDNLLQKVDPSTKAESVSL